MNRINFQEGVNAGTPKPCTIEQLNALLDSPQVAQICKQIAELDPNSPDYNDRKQALKKRLPILLPHASAFKNGRRKSEDAIPSGQAMLDVDHVEDPRGWFNSIEQQLLIDNHINLVAQTASGHGLRIVGERYGGESIEQAQVRIAAALGIKEYDGVTKDLARASYVTPRSYVFWIQEKNLCEWPYEEVKEYWTAMTPKEPAPTMTPEEPAPAITTQQPSTAAVAPASELTFKGVPYRMIINHLMNNIGAGGGVVQGERNTTYFSLANYVRYITDFSAELMLSVLPDFGLSLEERRSIVNSALSRPRRAQIPNMLQAAISMSEREVTQLMKLEKASQIELPPLPKLLRILCRRLPEAYRWPMIIASLPVLGALATRIRFHYLDMQVHSLSFFSCILAPAASGKSFIRNPFDLLMTPINEQDEVERQKEQAYREALRIAKNSKNQPQDPHACPRNNGISISIAKLLQLLTYSEGKHLIGIGEELDTLLKTERAGTWSQKSDIYRLAFDNAEYGQAYMSDNSFSAHIRIYYNLVMTGTPNSAKRFFKDLENGLVTRVCFAQLPDTSFSEIPVFEPYTEAEKATIIGIARQLDSEQGMIACPQLGKVIGAWLEQKRQLAIDADSHAADMFRRRSAVIGFRAGMLCYLLENRHYTRMVGEFAEAVAEYVFRNQMELWGEQAEREMSESLDLFNTEKGAASSLLSLLPKCFTTADLISLRSRKGQSVSTSSIYTLLSRWKSTGRIEKTSDGRYLRLR